MTTTLVKCSLGEVMVKAENKMKMFKLTVLELKN
jgi:hypothetical protein